MERTLETEIMGTKRSSRYVILAEIIRQCRTPKSKAQLFYNLKTSYPHVDKILKIALRSGLIKRLENRKYQATEKGTQYVKKLSDLLSLLRG